MPDLTRQLAERLRTLARPDDPAADAELLARFAAERDAEAFAELVRRYGPVVLGVCRRVLRCPHAADDAFQATFLVLARRADDVRRRHLLGNWLYGVAYRTALGARRAAVTRQAREAEAARVRAAEPGSSDDVSDLRDVLDRELAALPDAYRAAILLCDLDGLPRKQAAERLGWPEGTLSGRLARGRALLARRLARYGLATAGGALAGADLSRAAVPAGLAEATVRVAVLVAAGEAVAAVAPAPVAALFEGASRAVLMTKLKALTAGLMVAGAVAAGAVGWRADAAATQDRSVGAPPAAKAGKESDKDRIARLERERDELLKKVAELQARLEAMDLERQAARLLEAQARERAEAARKQDVEARNRALRDAGAAPTAPPPGPGMMRPAATTSAAPPGYPPADLAAPLPVAPAAEAPPRAAPALPPLTTPPARPPAGLTTPLPTPSGSATMRPPGAGAGPPAPLPAAPATSYSAPPPPAARAAVTSKVYRVGDLAADEGEGEGLVRLVKATVEPRSWGNEAGAEFFAPRKVLVVRQTAEGHKQVAELLELLRAEPGQRESRPKQQVK